MADVRRDTGDVRQDIWDRRRETGDRRRETGVVRQETGGGRQEAWYRITTKHSDTQHFSNRNVCDRSQTCQGYIREHFDTASREKWLFKQCIVTSETASISENIPYIICEKWNIGICTIMNIHFFFFIILLITRNITCQNNKFLKMFYFYFPEIDKY